jgi:hypothetical protein
LVAAFTIREARPVEKLGETYALLAAGVGTGVYPLGAPHQIEFRLRITFQSWIR